jgi:hypothetical protein
MYFNCPQHRKDVFALPYLYIRRLYFTFQKNDFNPEKTYDKLSKAEFEEFIDKIHQKLNYFFAFKIAAILYIFYLAVCLFAVFWASYSRSYPEEQSSALKLLLFAGVVAGVCGYYLKRLQSYYILNVRMIIQDENDLLDHRNIFWAQGPSIKYLILKKKIGENEEYINLSIDL